MEATPVDAPAAAAEPEAAATVAEPERLPLAGLLPIATVTLPVKLVTVFPRALCATTSTDGLMASCAVLLLGATAKASLTAVALGSAGLDPPHAMSTTVIAAVTKRERVCDSARVGTAGLGGCDIYSMVVAPV